MLNYGSIDSEVFNASSRYIVAQALIYFTETPVVVTNSDYMVSFDIVEECLSESDSLDQTVIANMLNLKLSSTDKRFQPKYESGPYYGTIKEGVKIVVQVQPAGVVDWVDMGTFYVSNWQTDDVGYTATVAALDLIGQWSTKSLEYLVVKKYIFMQEYLGDVMTLLGVTNPTITLTRNIELIFAYPVETSVTRTLNQMLNASIAYMTVNRTEHVVVKSFINNNVVSATITDADQIISVNTRQTIKKPYTGCVLKHPQPEAKIGEIVLDINDYIIEANTSVTKKYDFNNYPVRIVDSVGVYSTKNSITHTVVKKGNKGITLTIDNSGAEDDTIQIQVVGEYIDRPSSSSDDAEGKLEVNNDYLHYDGDITWFTNRLNAFIGCDPKFVGIVARGNPLFELGDKLTVDSNRYGVTLTGTLIRAVYHYAGTLSAEYTLLNTSAMEAVV